MDPAVVGIEVFENHKKFLCLVAETKSQPSLVKSGDSATHNIVCLDLNDLYLFITFYVYKYINHDFFILLNIWLLITMNLTKTGLVIFLLLTFG